MLFKDAAALKVNSLGSLDEIPSISPLLLTLVLVSNLVSALKVKVPSEFYVLAV